MPFVAFSLFSMVIGAAISIFVGQIIIKPIQRMGRAFTHMEKGDFKIRVPENNRLHEINDYAVNFNKMLRELSNIETLRSDFVVNVSHEFKTPIAAIEGYATLLQDQSLTAAERERYTMKILDSTRQLNDLSGNVLNLSKLENQERIGPKSVYQLDEQIRKGILLLETKWSSKGIAFDLDLPEVSFYGSESLLLQVWSNIIDNAIKHSFQGGVIKITLAALKDEILVNISDHGKGMSAEVQRHIFEKFYQGDRARQSEGNGLGLAIVNRIVTLSEGSITVSSTVGQGSTFTVRLPNLMR